MPSSKLTEPWKFIIYSRHIIYKCVHFPELLMWATLLVCDLGGAVLETTVPHCDGLLVSPGTQQFKISTTNPKFELVSAACIKPTYIDNINVLLMVIPYIRLSVKSTKEWSYRVGWLICIPPNMGINKRYIPIYICTYTYVNTYIYTDYIILHLSL